MSTETIDIVVTETGSKPASDAVRGVGNAADAAGKQVDVFTQLMSTLKTVLAGYSVLKLVEEYRELADTFTGIQNRLKLVSTNAADLASQQAKLLAVANDTRGSFVDTASLYNKLAINASQLGIDTKDLIPVLSTINKVIAVSGATATEAKNGLLQFSQGLASNRFQGQDLKAVLDDIPQLGAAIAKGMGTTTSGLRKLGEEGKLSAKLVLDALQKSAPEIAKQFASLTPTIAQAFQVLKNNLLVLVGTFDQAQGFSGIFARALIVVAQHLDLIARAVKTAIETIGLFWVALQVQAGWNAFAAGVTAAYIRLNAYVAAAAAAGIETTVLSRAMVAFQTPIAFVTNAFRTLWAVIALNPLTFIITVIGALILLVYNFGDAIKLNASGSINLLGAFVGAWNYLLAAMVPVYNWVAGYIGPIFTALGGWIKAVWDLFVQFGTWLLGWLEKIIPSFAGASSAIGRWSAGLIKAMEDASKATNTTKDFKNTLDQSAGAAGDAKKAVDGFDSSVNTSAEDMKRFSLTTRNAFGEMVVASDEWARRSGANFNKVSQAANKTADAFTSAAESTSSSGGGGGGGSGGGSTSSSRSVDSGPNVQRTNAQFGGGVSTDGGQTFHFADDDVLNFKRTGYPIGNAVTRLYPQAWKELLAEVSGDNTLTEQVKSAAKQRHIPGFANGATFKVGGSGGVDSQLVQFMASPDEEVEVRNKNQQRQRRNSGGRTGTVVYMTVKTPDGNSFRRSNQQILLGLKSKLNQVA